MSELHSKVSERGLELVARGGRLFFRPARPDASAFDHNLVDVRLNCRGEGHGTHDEAISHLEEIERIDREARERFAGIGH